MKVTAEKIDAHKTVLEIEIPQNDVVAAVNRASQKWANKVSIPGFRKGKVPRKILEMHIGKETLKDEALDMLATKAFRDACQEHEIVPAIQPNFEIVTFEDDKPLVLKITVVLKPVVTLGQYKELKVIKPSAEVSAEDVDKELEILRDRHAKMIVVEDATLQNGDFAIIDFEGFVDGQPFKGGDAKGFPLEIGSGQFIPGFEDQLIGAVTGEERDVNVTFPEEYGAAELAAKEALFKVKVNDIKRKELPEIDAEFVKEVSKFDTVEELRADLENKLEKKAQEKIYSDYYLAVLQTATDNATVDVPEALVDHELDQTLQSMDENLKQRGSSLKQYLELTKTDEATMRQEYREQAKRNLTMELVIEAVIGAEELVCTDEDLRAEVGSVASTFKGSPEEFRKLLKQEGQIQSIARSALQKKAAKFIVDSAVSE
jgi:trigger factor